MKGFFTKKNIFTRAASAFTALFILMGSFGMLPLGITVSAESEGYWKLISVEDTHGDGYGWPLEGTGGAWKTTASGSKGSFYMKSEVYVHDKVYSYDQDHDDCYGEYIEINIDTSAPANTYHAGDTVSIDVDANFYASHASRARDGHRIFCGPGSVSMVLSESTGNAEHDYYTIIKFENADGERFIGPINNESKKIAESNSDTLTAVIPAGKKNGDKEVIFMDFYNGITNINTTYTYEWVADGEPEETEETDEEESGYWELYETEAGESETWNDGYNVNGWGDTVGDYCFENSLDVNVGKATKSWTCVNETWTASGWRTRAVGDTSTVTAETSTPPTIIKGGDTVTVHATLTGDYRKLDNGERDGVSDIAESVSMDICAIYNQDGNNYKWFEYGDGEDGLYTSWDDPTISADFKCEIKPGSTEGQILEIRPRTLGTQWYYRYQWHNGKAPKVDENGNIIEGDEEEPEEQYYWKFDGTRKYYGTAPGSASIDDGEYIYDSGDLSYKWTWKKIGGGYNFYYKCLKNETNDYDASAHDKGECKKEFASYNVTVDKINQSYLPGAALNMRLKIDAEKSKNLCPIINAWEFAYMTGINPNDDDPLTMDGRETYLQDSDGESQLAFAFKTTKAANESVFKEVKTNFPKNAKEGDAVYIVVLAQADDIQYRIGLRYVYTKGTPKGAGTVGLEGSDGMIFEKVDKDAWETPGEDGEGETVPLGILFGALGTAGTAAGALAAAGSTGSKKGKRKEESKKNSRYQMFIYKDFGDYIRKGAPVVGVFARIAEITEDGIEIDRPDLTANIHLFSSTEGLEVREVGIMNSYMGAEVRVPNEHSLLREGVVSARFSGAGGYFTENVKFRIIGRAYLEFPTDTEPVEKLSQMVILSGDGQNYDLNVTVCDFAEDPTTLDVRKSTARDGGENYVGISYEKTGRFTYKVHISNYSPAEPTRRETTLIHLFFRASNAKEEAEELFKLYVCPEGISVLSPPLNDQGQLVINTEDADPGEGVKIEPTELQLICAYRENGKNAIATKGFDISRFKYTDDRTYHILNEFEYEINGANADAGRYYINPKKVLLVDKAKPYIVAMPLAWPLGAPRYTLELPVVLDGEPMPVGELLDRDMERELLIRACNRYGITSGGRAQTMMREVRGRDLPGHIYREIRRAVCIEAMEYYTKEAEQFTALGDKMNKCLTVCQSAKWVGHQSMSYLMKAKFGDTAEFIVMPLLEAFEDVVGNTWADHVWGTDNASILGAALRAAESMFETKFFNLLNDMFTGSVQSFRVDKDLNIISKNLGSSTLKEKLKEMWQMIAGYNLTVLLRHMYMDDEPFWDAVKATLKEFTVNTLKQAFANTLANWFNLGDPDVGKKAIIDVFGDFFFNTVVDSTVNQVGNEKDGDDVRMVLKFGDAEIHITKKVKLDNGKVKYVWSGEELGELTEEVKDFGRNILKTFLDRLYSMANFLAPKAQAIPEVIPFTPEEEAEQLAKEFESKSITAQT